MVKFFVCLSCLILLWFPISSQETQQEQNDPTPTPKTCDKDKDTSPSTTTQEPEKKDPPNPPPPPRRAFPAPFESPPLPSSEYQGSPLIGVPPDDTTYPLIQSIYDTNWGKCLKKNRIRTYGWATGSINASSCHNSNLPAAYWIVPNQVELNQFVFRIERQVDSVQLDHLEIGFRSTFLYGIDYRYTTAGGWTSYQLLKDNRLYGYDFPEQYIEVYTPKVAQGMILRIGRWFSIPDIESSTTPDNYLASHSLLYTFDTNTQTGVLATIMLNQNWTIQAGIHAGTDMAPWYPGAVPTGLIGLRWVAPDNNDSVYLVLNSINSAKFRRFSYHGQPAGHDNYNYIVGTWQHKFNKCVNTKTEAYYMWERDGAVGGTPSIGPKKSFGGGGGIGATIPGITETFGAVNYTMFSLNKDNLITIRNEYWRDVNGERSGYPGTYSSHTIGWTHYLTSILQIRPELGYYRNWNRTAFDLGKKRGLVLFGADMTLRF